MERDPLNKLLKDLKVELFGLLVRTHPRSVDEEIIKEDLNVLQWTVTKFRDVLCFVLPDHVSVFVTDYFIVYHMIEYSFKERWRAVNSGW